MWNEFVDARESVNRVLSFTVAAPNTASSLLRRCYHLFIFFFFRFLFVSRYFNQRIDNDVHTQIKCIKLQHGRKRKIQSVESMAAKCTIFVYEMRCGANKWKQALDTLSTNSFSLAHSHVCFVLFSLKESLFRCFIRSLVIRAHVSRQRTIHSISPNVSVCVCALQNLQHLFACTQRSLVL